VAAFIIYKKKLEDYLSPNNKIIGEGFYSSVESYNLGSVEVAVKTILKKENKNLIWSEAQTYASLGNYDKLLKFYGVCEINDLPALILEHPKNSKSLKSIIKECEENKVFIENEKSVKIIKEITECLKYVHSKGFYHGDLKPSNVLVLDYDKEISDLSIKLIDFNLRL
jgi:serine/threonine protein kinase